MRVVFLFVALFFSHSSYCALENILNNLSTGGYLEPFAARLVDGSMKNEISNMSPPSENGTSRYDFNGNRYGLRIGWMLGKFVLGGEFSYANYSYAFSQPSGVPVQDSTIDSFLYSGFLMYRGERWVPWMGVLLSGDSKDSRQNMEFKNAGGITFGLGRKLTSWLQVNLEFRSYSFAKYINNGLEIELPSTEREKFDVNEFAIGISIPLELTAKK